MNARKLMYIMLALFVLVLGGTGLGISYMYGLLRDNVQTVNHIKIDAELNSQAQSSLTLVQRKFSDPDVEKLSEYLQQIVPGPAYRSQFIPDIYKYAQDSGVTISGLSFDTATTPSAKGGSTIPLPAGVTPMPISVTLDKGSSFDQFTNFLKKLENNLQHVQVNTLSMQPDPSDPSRLASATITLQVYIGK